MIFPTIVLPEPVSLPHSPGDEKFRFLYLNPLEAKFREVRGGSVAASFLSSIP